MKYAKTIARLSNNTLALIASNPEQSPLVAKMGKNAELFVAEVRQMFVQRSTDTGIALEELTQVVAEVNNPEEDKMDLQTQIKAIPALFPTGRVIPTQDIRAVNRGRVLNVLGDTIALGRIIWSISTKNQYGKVVYNTAVGDESTLQAVYYAIYNWFNNKAGEAFSLVDTYLVAKNSGKLGTVFGEMDNRIDPLIEPFMKARQFMAARFEERKGNFDKSAGVFAYVAGSTVKVTWNRENSFGLNSNSMVEFYKSLGFWDNQIPTAFSFTFKHHHFTAAGQHTYGRVMLTAPNGASFMYRPGVGQELHGCALDVVSATGINLYQMTHAMPFSFSLFAANLVAEFDIKTLEANVNAFFNVSVTAKEVTRKKDGKKFTVVEANAIPPAFAMHEDARKAGFWGVTGASNIGVAGVSNRLQTVKYWLENVNGVPMSTESANKLAARIDKLAKALVMSIYGGEVGNKYQFGQTVCVTEWVKATEKAKSALSTGVYWCSMEDYRTVGAVRMTSSTLEGGLKATDAPVGLISKSLHNDGMGLVSFGSIKAGWNGLNEMLGGDAKSVEQVVTFDMMGEDVTAKVVVLPKLPSLITNWFSIQMYKPADQDKLNADAAALLGRDVEKVLIKSSLIEQDDNFVNFILAYCADKKLYLAEALRRLEEEGTIVRKPFTCEVTPTEFDIMALSHGKEKAREYMLNLIKSRLNEGKEKQMAMAKTFLTNQVDTSLVYTYAQVVEMFYEATKPLCVDGRVLSAGTTVSALCGGAPNRAALVRFVDMLYGVQGKACPEDYIVIVDKVGGEQSVVIPTGKFFEGQTFKSNANMGAIVASGFLDKLRKYLKFGAEVLESAETMYGKKAVLTEQMALQFIDNVNNELESALFGKSLGKLKASGNYFVLGIAPWFTLIDQVHLPNLSRYAKGTEAKAVGIKTPLWTLEAHAQFNVQDMRNYVVALGIFTEEEIEDFLFLSECVCYIHPMNALALQNDSDGDLYRLTFHKGFTLPKFSARVLKNTYAFKHFFQSYLIKEMAYANKASEAKELVALEGGWDAVAEGSLQAYTGKKNVASYTSMFFRYMQAFQRQLETNHDLYVFKADLLATWIQVFAMNTIKHTAGSVSIANKFYGYPEYPENATDDQKKAIDAKYRKEAIAMLVETLTATGKDDAYHLSADFTVADRGLEAIAGELYDEVRIVMAAGYCDAALLLTRDRSPKDCGEKSVLGTFDSLEIKGPSLLNEMLAYYM